MSLTFAPTNTSSTTSGRYRVRVWTYRFAAAFWMGCLILLWARPTAHAAVGDPVTVCVFDGCLTGTTLAGDVHAFLGIPYAAPPVGDLRFRAPEDPLPWGTVARQATAFGPVCPRLQPAGTLNGSEDCLTLNVWAPANGTGRPVVVFIHPGLNSRGTARMGMASYGGLIVNTTWDGQPWAANQQIVFVSVEWRVNALGFLAHPALSAEDPHGSSGNYGVLDQVKALQWVQRNIATFGGDPSNVTLLGATAGAADVSVLVVSDLATGLFSRAILESPIWHRFPSLEAAQSLGSQIVYRVGCDQATDIAACLRAKPLSDIVRAAPFDSPASESEDYAPRIDGWVLKGDPLDLIEGDLAPNKASLLVGSTADEYNAHALDSDVAEKIGLSRTATAEDYENAIRTRFGDGIGTRILTLYDPASPEFATSPLLDLGLTAPFAAMLRLLTDSAVTCPVRVLARRGSTGGRTVYRYFFTHAVDDQPTLRRLGAFDNEDNWFVFNATPYSYSPGELVLAEAIQGYWAAFATIGDPNGGGRPAWPPYNRLKKSDNVLELDTLIHASDGIRTEQCDLWNFLDRQ